MLLVYGFQYQEKNNYMTMKNLGGFPWKFMEPKRLLQMVSHDLWARNQKLFSMGFEIL